MSRKENRVRPQRLEVRLSPDEKLKIEELARVYGHSVGDYVRTQALCPATSETGLEKCTAAPEEPAQKPESEEEEDYEAICVAVYLEQSAWMTEEYVRECHDQGNYEVSRRIYG